MVERPLFLGRNLAICNAVVQVQKRAIRLNADRLFNEEYARGERVAKTVVAVHGIAIDLAPANISVHILTQVVIYNKSGFYPFSTLKGMEKISQAEN